jgi:heme/copper-type cytochrome/quinol oxidase subunit 3
MAQQATARKISEPTPQPAHDVPAHGGTPPSYSRPAISNARLGLLMLIAAESMLFAGLIGAFLVFRLGSGIWPPPFQPRLPVLVTGVNTLVLLLSGWSARQAVRLLRSGTGSQVRQMLLTAGLLGFVFLAVQGFEWVRLIRFGLTLSSGVYGATFYSLIGLHGLHVLVAVIWLAIVVVQTKRGILSLRRKTGVEICVLYWTFVVALWPVLYGLVYLL